LQGQDFSTAANRTSLVVWRRTLYC